MLQGSNILRLSSFIQRYTSKIRNRVLIVKMILQSKKKKWVEKNSWISVWNFHHWIKDGKICFSFRVIHQKTAGKRADIDLVTTKRQETKFIIKNPSWMLRWMRWIVWDIDFGLSIRKWAEVSILHSKEARSNTRLTAIGLIHQIPDIHIKKYLVKLSIKQTLHSLRMKKYILNLK